MVSDTALHFFLEKLFFYGDPQSLPCGQNLNGLSIELSIQWITSCNSESVCVALCETRALCICENYRFMSACAVAQADMDRQVSLALNFLHIKRQFYIMIQPVAGQNGFYRSIIRACIHQPFLRIFFVLFPRFFYF